MTEPAKTLILIDGSSYVFRAYHAVPPMSTSKGVPTNAAFGFTNMLRRALREASATHVAVALDREGKTFRHDLDPAYKANRPPPPDDLVPQFALVRRIVDAMNVPVVEAERYEADDVIATLARRARAQGFEVVIVTGDKDFLQILGDGTVLYDSMKERRTSETDVPERLGVRADQVVDYLALVGDAVDNVPGVPGVGPKTAAQLLDQFGDVETLLRRLDEVKKGKLREAIRAGADQLRRAQELVRLQVDLDLDVTLDDLARRPPDDAKVRSLFTELEFASLLRELPRPAGPSPEDGAMEVVADDAALARLARSLAAAERFAVRATVDGRRPRTDPLVGLAFAWPDGRAYLPIGHQYLGAPRPLPAAEVLAALGPALADVRKAKVGHDVKSTGHALVTAGAEPASFAADAELFSYLLNPARREHALADLAREVLGRELPEDPAAARGAGPPSGVPVESAGRVACAAADASLRLVAAMEPELRSAGLDRLAAEIEMPLVPVLVRMERAGMNVDRRRLAALAEVVDGMLAAHQAEIHRLAGRRFNINSNPQLAEVLFQELKLPILRRGKTGPSADQEVLEKLAQQHPIAGEVLEYRSLAKLKGTYIDALPELIEPDGRIHTVFHQAAAATGRLSSSDPNLQNIPVRTELGKRIREAFVAPEGWTLLSADYSQIELRVLAHLSGDPALCEAFARGEDVHARTAAELFGVAPDRVTPEMRRTAKAVNFGIAYGQSAFGLSQRLDLGGGEAQAIIDRYFTRYRGVRAWLDGTLEVARRDGCVRTLFGRRRSLPDLSSQNFAARQAAERMAVNTPMQGTSADLIKRAMIDVDARLVEQGLRARMLLQVHDELLLEVPHGEVDVVRALVVDAMSQAAELKVPLVVDVGTGATWADAH